MALEVFPPWIFWFWIYGAELLMGLSCARAPGALWCAHTGCAADPRFHFALEIASGFKLCNEGKCKKPFSTHMVVIFYVYL